jgi:hypothetical protein
MPKKPATIERVVLDHEIARYVMHNAPLEIQDIAMFMDGRPCRLTENDTQKVYDWLAKNPPSKKHGSPRKAVK